MRDLPVLLRFPNAPGALIFPFHGHGELSQAFCRRAVVKGCLYVSAGAEIYKYFLSQTELSIKSYLCAS